MTKEQMQNFVSGLESKLGKENAGIIADDLGVLITDNNNMNDNYEKLQNDYKSEQDKTKKLTQANSSLLMQVGNYLADDSDPINNPKEEKLETFKDVSFSEFFDSKGRFIR